MSGGLAESTLREHGGNCYLTRYSQDKDCLRLSVMKEGKNGAESFSEHFQINIMPDRRSEAYEIEGSDCKFDDIFDLLTFYQVHPVSLVIDSIGECVKKEKSRPKEVIRRGSSLQNFIPSRPPVFKVNT